LVTHPRHVAKTGSGFRKYFRGPVSHRAVKSKTGFERGVSLSTGNSRFLVSALDRLIIYASTVA